MGTTQSKRDSITFFSNTQKVVQYVTPTGLYPTTNDWDLRTIKKMVVNGKIAPLYPGKEKEEDEKDEMEECPICFLHYPSLNRSGCCKKPICSECFIQIKKPQFSASCPFCNRQNLAIHYIGVKTQEEKAKEEEEQQKVIELKLKMQKEEIERDKQREEERKKRAQSVSSPPSDQPSENTTGSLPSSPIVRPTFQQTEENSSPQPKTNSFRSSGSHVIPQRTSIDEEPEVDYEEFMLMEAIRLSLMDMNAQKKEVAQSKPMFSMPKFGETSPVNTEINTNSDSSEDELNSPRDHSTLNTTEHRAESIISQSSPSTARSSVNISSSGNIVVTNNNSNKEEIQSISSVRSSISVNTGDEIRDVLTKLKESNYSDPQALEQLKKVDVTSLEPELVEDYELSLAISLSLAQEQLVL